MATAAPTINQSGSNTARKKWGLILVMALILVAIAAGAAWYLMSGKADTTPSAAARERAAPPVFLPLETFTVNLQPETGDQYFQVALTLRVRDASVTSAVKLRMPEVRSRLLILLSNKRASDLISPEGKEKLAREIADNINVLISEAEPPDQTAPAEGEQAPEVKTSAPVMSVLFTSFVIQ